MRQQHMNQTLERVRKRTALDLGAPRIPQVKWQDVGGLEHVKKAILETIELPLKFRHALCLATDSDVLFHNTRAPAVACGWGLLLSAKASDAFQGGVYQSCCMCAGSCSHQG